MLSNIQLNVTFRGSGANHTLVQLLRLTQKSTRLSAIDPKRRADREQVEGVELGLHARGKGVDFLQSKQGRQYPLAEKRSLIEADEHLALAASMTKKLATTNTEAMYFIMDGNSASNDGNARSARERAIGIPCNYLAKIPGIKINSTRLNSEKLIYSRAIR